MNFKEFFDRRDQAYVSVLFYFAAHNSPYPRNQLLQDLSISPFILKKTTEELTHIMGELELDSKIMYVDHLDSFVFVNYSWEDILTVYHYLVDNSLPHKILLYIYRHNKFSIQTITQNLAISEATLYRCIANLNALLKEFELTIRNGAILGDSLQRNYFFLSFFLASIPIEDIQKNVAVPEIKGFIDLLEKKLGIPLTPSTKIRLSLWCKIINESRSMKLPLSRVILKLTTELQHDPLYTIIKECYFLSISYSALLESDYTVACIYLFLLSSFPFEIEEAFKDDKNGCPSSLNKVEIMNELILTEIDKQWHETDNQETCFLDYHSKFLLSQIHCKINYFIGEIVSYDSDQLIQMDSTSLADQQFLRRLLALIEAQVSRKLGVAEKFYTSWVYSKLISQLKGTAPNPIKIGIHLYRTPLLADIYVDNIKKSLAIHTPLFIEAALPNKAYDVLISDNKEFSRCFTFNEFIYIQNLRKKEMLSLLEIIKEKSR